MLFNQCKSHDFELKFDEIKLLKFTLSSYLKWTSNTHIMVNKAFKRLWILKGLNIQLN